MEDTGGVERGMISQIYVENFVTYDSVVIKPGRNLNLIIGPNGTGKSTIVCAIVLGLGGKPKIIGRALRVGEYVKAGCQEAKIEIELHDPGKRNIVITRVFDVEDRSTWRINKKTVTLKELETQILNLNIQVDNLCQFLPQDKVQDFSKMNAQELLENTERSVGDPMLLEYHTKLKNYRKRHKELEVQIENKKNLLETQTQKYDRLKEIVGGIKERKVIKKRIITLKQKKAWILYDTTRKELCEAKKGRDKAGKEMEELKNTMKPINAAINKLKNEVKNALNSMNQHSNQVSAKARKVMNTIEELSTCEQNIEEIENKRETALQAEATRDQEIAAALQQQSKLENDLELIVEESGSEESLAKQQQEIVRLIDEQRRRIDKLQSQSANYRMQDDRVKHEIGAQESELQTAKDVGKKRLELLRHRSSDAYKGVLWIRENADKFRAKVHEPMLLTINVISAKYSKYLEHIISDRDLVAFVCEDKQDMNLLLRYLRDGQRLQINVVHSDPDRNVQMNPRIPIEHLRPYGFEYYLNSLIDAPQTIMKFLVSMYRINNIPLGNSNIEDNVENIPNSLNCFYSQNNCYSVSMSKYTGAKATRITCVMGDGTLSIILDTTKLQGIGEKLNTLKAQRDHTIQNLKQIEEQVHNAEAEMAKYRTTRSNCQRNIEQIRTVRSRITIVKRKVEDLRVNRTSVEEITEIYQKRIKEAIMKEGKVYKQCNTFLGEYFEISTVSESARLELKLAQRNLAAKENESQELKERCTGAERTFRRLDEELQPLRNEAKRMLAEALESTNGIGPQNKGFRSINDAFSKLPATIEDINEDLRVAHAKVFCLGKNQDGEDVLRDFEKVTADVQSLKDDIETQTTEMQDAVQKMEDIRGKWLPPLEHLVERINGNFSRYFADMRCAGEVSIGHGQNIMDYDQYGLNIRVKFRDTDELQELTRHHQSGGERAVTTAIYMIALQELSRVPFRCVDEINQGMDAINERRVFELIVNITGHNKGSQYFLLTPKLLPALLYNETVTVHCVFNGPFMVSHKEFDMESYCQRAIRMEEKENLSQN